jgi:hypothetical protein
MRSIDLSANLRGADLSKANFRDLSVQAVIFRVLTRDPQKGEVIALFPFMPEPNGLVNSYMHVGQHGAADYAGMLRQSRKALPHEYMPLYRELTQAPYHYNLIVFDRKPRS